MEGVKKEKKRLKTKLTRLEKNIGDLDLDTASEAERILLAGNLNTLEEEFDRLLQKLSDVADDDEYTEMETDLNEADSKIHALKVVLLSVAGSDAPPTPVRSIPERQSEIKLPKLDMPTFSGSIQGWLSFRDLFSAIVHKNSTLSGAERLQYLKLALRGEPAQLIQSIAITDANYEEAWNLLNERYQNTREIVNSHIDRMLSQPTIHQESAIALRKLADTTVECRRSLELLKVPITHWDAIIVNIITKKLDPDSRRQWELSLNNDSIPTFEQLNRFMDQRARALSTIDGGKGKYVKSSYSNKSQVAVHHESTSATKQECDNCKKDHTIYKCPELLKATVAERHNIVQKLLLCFNCLRPRHNARDCKAGGCRKCNRRHHTLLHYINEGRPAQDDTQVQNGNAFNGHILDEQSVQSFSIGDQQQHSQVLLTTALIKIKHQCDQDIVCRALLDSASQASFITEACVQRLKLARVKTSIPVTGLNSAGLTTIKSQTHFTFTSVFAADPKYAVDALIVPKITCPLPNTTISQHWPHLNLLKLADPTFYEPSSIDVLLGADIFAILMRNGRQTGPEGSPVALETELGWVLTGRITGKQNAIQVHHVHCNIDEAIQRFWELETISASCSSFTSEEQGCEDHFAATHTRDATGRYVVQLPLRNQETKLGSSREKAIHRLKCMERRLKNHPNQQTLYQNFMKEYADLKHMELVPESEVVTTSNQVYYMPHHSVLNNDSSTTKLRVVFDASAKTDSGVSLNDCLMVGPGLQTDLISILLRFRTYPIAICADIEKMYRQVLVHPQQTNLQRIVWRESEEYPIKDYRLLTVTYGTASAPYLAIKALQQLARDEETAFPAASKSTIRDFYVDDYMSGANDENEAIELINQMNNLMNKGGFSLRKWCSNSSKALEAIPKDQKNSDDIYKVVTEDTVKTLGIFWHPEDDYFSFNTLPLRGVHISTKRQLLSDISKIFDPLGWISPITIKAKILMQTLWRLHLEWDEPLPEDVWNTWKAYREDLVNIEYIHIKRCITISGNVEHQLFAFCDASEKAYAAVVYCKTTDDRGNSRVALVASKTRVAPLKRISIPRLELCAAVLLAELVKTIRISLNMPITKIHAYSDSTIVLTWLSAHSARWKTFVANRVTQIHENIPEAIWRHVCGEENPADCASRGTTARELTLNSNWWWGPSWLKQEPSTNFNFSVTPDQENFIFEEERKSTVTMLIGIDLTLLHKYSSLSRLIRITTWCMRFKKKSKRNFGFLKTHELENALNIWIKIVQNVEFADEIRCLRNNQQLPKKSRILSLKPYMDETGLVRVGGRLQHAKIHEQRKHPILLPRKNRLTTLIVESAHINNLHAGPQLLSSILHKKFWIICSRDVVRYIVKKCITCHRQYAQTAQQLMGNLPASRVNVSKAFCHTGVDYAGPLVLRPILKRSKVEIKCYIAVFVCMATRAIHLELVSDLTSTAFIATLKRFISRRGKPLEIYSDCGKNFVGANKEMSSYIKLMKSHDHNHLVGTYLSEEGISWNFNPPSAAHFGGLWEAGVKSVKYHLKRVVGLAKLTFEEMYTVLVQIEACLNSRPLTPMSSDPSDLTALTPGHFLVGDSLLALPEPDLTNINMNKLTRWQFVQQIVQHFWRRWSGEYLSRLQQRPKWQTPQPNLKVHDMVLVKDEQLPPTKWKLGRIEAVHPGKDGLVRVATVRTSSGKYTRPIVKLSRLPIDDN